ncbi:MAG: aldehyde dehydrogenase family protein [Rhodobacteraceae bacterium]|nr:aldehyde dehydrogenase family protein [Paracoccaceae bacterium]
MTDNPLSVAEKVDRLVARARYAMATISDCGQRRIDHAVTALAWSLYKPENAAELAEMAVRDTGLGNVESKIVKNTRKTFGTLRDLMRAKTVGLIGEDPAAGIALYGKPVGVVGAVCPSTNPSATPVNKAMMAVKGANAIVIAPSPAGYPTTARCVALMRDELERAGFPGDLVQILPAPVDKALTQALLEKVDLAVVTGSQDNVRRAMRSGSVAIGVGAGNVPSIIDASADLDDAADKIARSKIFDNSTSCSSENSVVILDPVYDEAVAALKRAGGWLCSREQHLSVKNMLWLDGKLNRRVIAKDASTLAELFGLPPEAAAHRFFMVEENEVGGKGSFADEKLSLVLTLYRAGDFAEAKRIAAAILDVTGKGHSVGIHTRDMRNARDLAESTDVVRVLVNQAHTFGNGGSFNNSLPFTLSMGGGTWAGNALDDNLNYRCFINVTRLVTVIPEDRPSEEELFGDYWENFGK